MGTNNSFFAGANSENGFISYYSSVDSDSENTMVYNIVGGPGTGKSALLNKIYEYGKAAEYECERYFCSSDPSSLDAVKISSPKSGRRIFACDSTPPHPRPLTSPGAVGKLVDLTRFWNEKELRRNRPAILELQRKKSEEYQKVYGNLKMAGMAKKALVFETITHLKKDVIHNFIASFIENKNNTTIIKRPVRAISMNGVKSLDNQGFGAKKRYYIPDPITCSAVCEYVISSSNILGEIWAAPDPITGCFYNELYFPASSVCISCVDINGSTITNEDIIESYVLPQEFITTYKIHKEAALAHLEVIRKIHFEMEAIYGATMDFERKEKHDRRIVKDISSVL